MPSKVILLNKQRRDAIDIKWAQSVTDVLFDKVLDNLNKSCPAFIAPGLLPAVAARGNISLALVSNNQIKKLNKDWMNKNYPTDVLSFPLCLDAPPEPLPWEIGEIVISIEKAREQAETFGHSFEREFAFLFVHGVLHVFGFDHMTPEDEKEMFGRQKKILDKAGFLR